MRIVSLRLLRIVGLCGAFFRFDRRILAVHYIDMSNQAHGWRP